MFRQIGPTEILIILGVVVLLFGGRKLPEVARGSGRALRIFKSEIKGLHDDDETDQQPEADSESESVRAVEDSASQREASTQPETSAQRESATQHRDTTKEARPDKG